MLKLPRCMLWCLSTENRSPWCDVLWFQCELCQTQMGCATVPPANGRTCPEERGAKLGRCWEQKEAAGRSLAIQWHKAVRSMLCDAAPFLFFYPAWHLGFVHTARCISTGKVLKCPALGIAASWPLPLRSLWGLAREGIHSTHVLTIIQQSKHPARHTALAAACRNTNLLLLKLFDFILKINRRMRKRANSRANALVLYLWFTLNILNSLKMGSFVKSLPSTSLHICRARTNQVYSGF